MSHSGEPRIRAVLDHTALQSYARSHVHVGELLGEVADDDNGVVGIPAVALTDAHARSSVDPQATALLNYVVKLPGAAVLDLDRATAPIVARYVPAMLGNLSRAQTAWAALTFDVPCFTTEPDAYPHVVAEDRIIAIPTVDA